MHGYVELEAREHGKAPPDRRHAWMLCRVAFIVMLSGGLSLLSYAAKPPVHQAGDKGVNANTLAKIRTGEYSQQRLRLPCLSRTVGQRKVSCAVAASTLLYEQEEGVHSTHVPEGANRASFFQPLAAAAQQVKDVSATFLCKLRSPARPLGVNTVVDGAATLRLRIVNFNVLAPSARICTPLNSVSWRERHEAICNTILALAPDIVCLQEFDFASKTCGFSELYEAKLGHLFDFHLKQRTGFKNEGLAVLVRREAFEDVEVSKFNLEPWFSNRVAILTKMTHKISQKHIVLINTHLTVAHASNDYDIPMCRPMQMDQVLSHLEGAVGEDSLTFVCADMNSDHMETEDSGRFKAAEVSRPVAMAFEEGFWSALHTAHPGTRPISHACDYAHSGCADYIFFKPSADLMLGGAFLYPDTVPLDATWDEGAGWGRNSSTLLPHTLSDHRPLVADFQLAPPNVPVIPEGSGSANGEIGVRPSLRGPSLGEPGAAATL